MRRWAYKNIIKKYYLLAGWGHAGAVEKLDWLSLGAAARISTS
jgi:hypothetical protein